MRGLGLCPFSGLVCDPLVRRRRGLSPKVHCRRSSRFTLVTCTASRTPTLTWRDLMSFLPFPRVSLQKVRGVCMISSLHERLSLFRALLVSCSFTFSSTYTSYSVFIYILLPIHIHAAFLIHINFCFKYIYVTQTAREELWPPGRNAKNQFGKSKAK